MIRNMLVVAKFIMAGTVLGPCDKKYVTNMLVLTWNIFVATDFILDVM